FAVFAQQGDASQDGGAAGHRPHPYAGCARGPAIRRHRARRAGRGGEEAAGQPL
ncbi:MAG: hypothetical protein AVDCRST_MAG89-1361, partial [uncultured Gemmatimonadetes bacterium]